MTILEKILTFLVAWVVIGVVCLAFIAIALSVNTDLAGGWAAVPLLLPIVGGMFFVSYRKKSHSK